MGFGTIIPIVVLIAILFVSVFAFSVNRVNPRVPIETLESRVLNKRVKRWSGGAGTQKIDDYFIAFDVNGERIELKALNKKQYDNIAIGEKGVLKYQRKRFVKLLVDFEKFVSKD